MENPTNLTQTILLSDVKVLTRIRTECTNIANLAESIRQHGLIQPVVLNRDNTLVAGERRYRAHLHLGLDRIKFVYTDQVVEEDVKAELEFEENRNREDFPWQDEALGVLKIYRMKRQCGMLEGWTYSQQLAADMFKMSVGNINLVLQVAKKLEGEKNLPMEKRRYWQFTSCNEAYRLGLMAEQEDAATAELARRAKLNTDTLSQVVASRAIVEEVKRIEASPDLLAKERERYASNPLNSVPFDTYWKERQAERETIENTVYLSNQLVHADCIEYMNDPANSGRFNHIITDPPYGIDMDNLNQLNQHGGMNIERVEDAHQVEENLDLLARFFPAAWKCTDDKAFVIVCGDVMVWQHMYDLATKVGFAVQRWPFIWRKVGQSVMNNCPGYNTTKDFEIAMICRKPGATLFQKLNTSFKDASNVEAVKLTGHPFAKPFELTRTFIEAVSMERQLILDPFMGGGSMILEILRAKRNVVGVEKELHHYNGTLETIKREYYLKLNPRFTFK